jgi:PIN domain nuclease of toxin-antitoxin system
MVVLDTHAWIWWMDDPSRLSPAAWQALERAEAIGVAAISCWEAGMLALTGRVTFEPQVERWVRLALGAQGVSALPTSPKVALDAALLGGEGFAGDPADRLIYATAVDAGATLVTRDSRMRAFDPRGTLW